MFDPNKFAEDLALDTKEVMNYINVLSDKGLITVKTLKTDKDLIEEHILLDNFYDKLSLLVMEEVNDSDKKETDIYEVIQKEFGRTLGTIEIEIINAWLDNNISEELINEAMEYIDEIAEKIFLKEFEIYFGQLPEENFALDYHYGKYKDGDIIKNGK